MTYTNYWQCQCEDCFYRWEFHETPFGQEEPDMESESTEDKPIDPHNADVVDIVSGEDTSEGANASILDLFIAQAKLPRYIVRVEPEYCPRCQSPAIQLWSEKLLLYPKIFNDS